MSLSFAISWLAACAAAAGFGTVRGIVHDPDHRPVDAASITLRSVTSDYAQTARTGSGGDFLFAAAPIGRYVLEVA
ncbi:MAG: carboxypeptidase-like regulatory domain-containing protein, partial [Acidobacteriia bacterium]|nr:carboxypeptidase-like regulatory domain-containing protein [Terriglobia bacterium]